MFPTHSGMAFGVARRRAVNSITTPLVVPGGPAVAPPSSPATIESTQASTISEEGTPIIREGPQRRVVIVNPRDRDPYRYAIGPYETVPPGNVRLMDVRRATQINSGESTYTFTTIGEASSDNVSIIPPMPRRRDTYDDAPLPEPNCRASSVYSRPISALLSSQQQEQPQNNRESYYAADPVLVEHAELAESFLIRESRLLSAPRYIPDQAAWAAAIPLAAEFVDEDRDDDYSTIRESERAASMANPSLLVDDDTVTPIPYNNITSSPALEARLQNTLSEQTHQTLASSNTQTALEAQLQNTLSEQTRQTSASFNTQTALEAQLQNTLSEQTRQTSASVNIQTTLESRWNRRIAANDEPTLTSIERRPNGPLPESATLTETMDRTFHDIKERQEREPVDPELLFNLGHHHATDSPCPPEYLKVTAEINGVRTSNFAAPSSPLILLPGLCGYAQDYADYLLRTHVEPHRQDAKTRAEEQAKLTDASCKMVNDWLDAERHDVATRQFTPSASVIALQPISRPQTASSHAALASQSRNPFKRAINTLKKRKTTSDIKDVATTQAKKEEKKGRSIGSFLFGRAASKTTTDLALPASGKAADAAALAALAARTAYRPAAPLALFSEAARRLHLTNRATAACVVSTDEGQLGHLTVANWLQAMKYRSGEREKELFSRITDGEGKWLGVGMNEKGRWCLIVVG